MTTRPLLYRGLRLANAVLFLTAVGLILDHSVAAALSRITGDPHWSTAGRTLVVADKTGDPAWHQANQFAVAVWNEAGAGTGLRLTWTAATGSCDPESDRIVVCGASADVLDDHLQLRREGVTRIELGDDHAQAHIAVATVLVCADCPLRAARRRVVATHELGHALGLPHTPRIGSVMYPTGGPERPDAVDVAGLRSIYGHVDAVDRCGFFDARVGPLCF